MNFSKSRFGQGSPEPEINLIPFIDVLLVVLIFLMLTTTYSRYTELEVVLPVAQALREAARRIPTGGETVLVISADENSSHQAVIRVMDAARRSGLERIVFATRQPQEAR